MMPHRFCVWCVCGVRVCVCAFLVFLQLASRLQDGPLLRISYEIDDQFFSILRHNNDELYTVLLIN